MAADGLNNLRIKLVECEKVYYVDVHLPYEEAGDVLTVEHMCNEFERVTGIPKSIQGIIFKHKVLHDAKRSLVSCGIHDMSEIHLMKLTPPDTSFEAQMKVIEKQITCINKKLSQIISEADGIHRGYYARGYHTQSFHHLRARLAECARELQVEESKLNVMDMKNCEPDVKDIRRPLIRWIETLYYRIEGLDNGIRDVIARIDEQFGMQMSATFGRQSSF
jgi:hypothetical protein